MGKSAISWTDATWNPVTGCTRVSPGCRLCYAFALHDQRHEAWKRGTFPDAPKQYHVPFSQVQVLDEARIVEPLTWRKRRRCFVCSMADLFHQEVPDHALQKIYGVMAVAAHHEFYVLTKRPQRMSSHLDECWPTPLNNVVHGVSVESQRTYDARAPILASAVTRRRFLSIEPLLEEDSLDLSLEQYHPTVRPDWIIVGGESGAGFREMNMEVFESVCEQALRHEIPLHVKQDSGRMPGGQGRISDELWKHKSGPLELSDGPG